MARSADRVTLREIHDASMAGKKLWIARPDLFALMSRQYALERYFESLVTEADRAALDFWEAAHSRTAFVRRYCSTNNEAMVEASLKSRVKLPPSRNIRGDASIGKAVALLGTMPACYLPAFPPASSPPLCSADARHWLFALRPPWQAMQQKP